MTDAAELRALLDVIARHRVLPPPGALPADSERLREILAEIARGSRSVHAGLIQEAATAHRASVEELARRAGFILACVALPASGTHYELLGVSPTASRRVIRQRWSTLIQRYHPDHAGPDGGLGDQARRLIEAYQTLRDPGRRRRYDAELARRDDWTVATPVELPARWRRLRPPARWRWAPAAIAAIGAIVVLARWTSHQPVTPSHPSRLPAAVGEPDPAEAEERPSGALARDLVAPEPRADAVPSSAPRGPGARGQQDASPGSHLRVSDGPRDGATALPSLAARVARLEASPAEPGPAGAAHGVGEAERSAGGRGAVATGPSDQSGAPGETGAPAPDGGGQLSTSAIGAAVSAPDTAQAAPERAAPLRQNTAPRRTVAAVPPRADVARAQSESAIALIESFRSAYERKDLEGLARLLDPDVREGQAVGRGAVERLYARNFRALDGIRYELSQLTEPVATRDGGLAVQGRFRIRAVNLEPRAHPIDLSGPIRWVLRRDGDGYRIVAIEYSARER